MVRPVGVEPTCPHRRRVRNPVCIPVSPQALPSKLQPRSCGVFLVRNYPLRAGMSTSGYAFFRVYVSIRRFVRRFPAIPFRAVFVRSASVIPKVDGTWNYNQFLHSTRCNPHPSPLVPLPFLFPRPSPLPSCSAARADRAASGAELAAILPDHRGVAALRAAPAG